MMFLFNNSYFIYSLENITLFAAVFLPLTVISFFLISKKLKNNRIKAKGLWILVWVIIGAFMFNSGTFGTFADAKTINSKTYIKDELTQDLQQLEKCIMNKNPLYFADKTDLQQLFSNAYEDIEDGMNEMEFYRLINPIVAAVNCGHTNLSISEALLLNREQTAKFFPLNVTLVDNQLYILENDPAAGIIAGDEIKSINGISNEEIINILLNNISGDGDYETKRRYIISKHFNSRFYDFVDSSDNFHVVLINNEGITKTADLQAKFRDEFNTTAWGLHSAEYKNGNYYESEIYENHAVLTIHVFMNEKDNKFDAFLDALFIDLKEKNITKLVIDLRGNFGGDPFMAKSLLSHLTAKEFEYLDCDLPPIYNLLGFKKPVSPNETIFNGDVVVLIDGAGFSTTAHLCALIQYHNLGTLVGSETGGSYVCTDGSKDVVLKHTRMRLHYSTLTFKVMVDGFSDGNGVKPDIFVSPTIEDILKNRNPIMENGLKILDGL